MRHKGITSVPKVLRNPLRQDLGPELPSAESPWLDVSPRVLMPRPWRSALGGHRESLDTYLNKFMYVMTVWAHFLHDPGL